MAHMHATAGRTPSSVQKEGYVFFVFVQYHVKVPMTEYQAPAQEPMGRFSSKSLEPFEHRFVDSLRPKLVNQLVIVYGDGLSMFVNSSRDIERGDYLLFPFRFLGS